MTVLAVPWSPKNNKGDPFFMKVSSKNLYLTVSVVGTKILLKRPLSGGTYSVNNLSHLKNYFSTGSKNLLKKLSPPTVAAVNSFKVKLNLFLSVISITEPRLQTVAKTNKNSN